MSNNIQVAAPNGATPTGSTGPNDAKYAARADAAAAKAAAEPRSDIPGADKGSEPAPLAGKFKTVEDLEKAYKALETKLGSAAAPPQKDSKQSAESSKQGTEEGTQPTELTAETFSGFVNEYTEKGALSEESYKALAGMGISKDLADDYISSRKAKADAEVAEILNTVGGKDAYTQMLLWASESMQPEEIAEFNKSVTSGDKARSAFAVKALATAYRAATSSDPKVSVSGGRQTTQTAFASKAEMTAAMQDPRYSKDPDYRASVMARTIASDF